MGGISRYQPLGPLGIFVAQSPPDDHLHVVQPARGSLTNTDLSCSTLLLQVWIYNVHHKYADIDYRKRETKRSREIDAIIDAKHVVLEIKSSPEGLPSLKILPFLTSLPTIILTVTLASGPRASATVCWDPGLWGWQQWECIKCFGTTRSGHYSVCKGFALLHTEVISRQQL